MVKLVDFYDDKQLFFKQLFYQVAKVLIHILIRDLIIRGDVLADLVHGALTLNTLHQLGPNRVQTEIRTGIEFQQDNLVIYFSYGNLFGKSVAVIHAIKGSLKTGPFYLNPFAVESGFR